MDSLSIAWELGKSPPSSQNSLEEGLEMVRRGKMEEEWPGVEDPSDPMWCLLGS